MAFKRLAASQHMNAEVAAMSAQVFSQYTYLVEAGACIGYGEGMEETPDDWMEALTLDLLLLDPGAAGEVSAGMVTNVCRKYLGAGKSGSEIEALMRSAWKKRLKG